MSVADTEPPVVLKTRPPTRKYLSLILMGLVFVVLFSQVALHAHLQFDGVTAGQTPVSKIALSSGGRLGMSDKSESLLQVAILDCSSLHLGNNSKISRTCGTVELIGSKTLNFEEDFFLRKAGKHVMLTGGAGYIGSHMALLLLEQGYSVTIVDNLSRGRPEAVNVLQVEACRRKSRFAFAFVDLGSRPHLEALLLASRPDWVIHFASLAFVGESMTRPLLYFRNVTENTLILLTAMDRAGVKKLVYSSSCSTYGEHTVDEMPITEKTPQRPKSIYAQSKMMAEQMLVAWANRNPEVCVRIMRYFNVIGADPEGRLGEIPSVRGDDRDSRISNALFDAASKRIAHFKVYGMDFPTRDGTCERDYVHVSDLVSAHLLMLQQHAPSEATKSCGHDVYNIGIGVPISVMQLLSVVQQLPGADPFEVVSLPHRPGDVPLVYADPSKIKSIGWSPRFTNLTEALLTAWLFRIRHAQFFPGSNFSS